MILLDRPYVSDLLLRTIAEQQLPVVATAAAVQMGLAPGSNAVDEDQAASELRRTHEAGSLKLYTNSENALGWVAEHLAGTALPDLVDCFKDKARFRRMTAPLTPGYGVHEVRFDELDAVDPTELSFPLVVKPAVGFFSAGVRHVARAADWPAALADLRRELEGFASVYPASVLDAGRFVVEPYVAGREFAIDAYYDAQGEPVLLGLLEHDFSSQNDVGDRLYTTSAALINEYREQFTDFLAELGRLTGARDIPVHVEVRLTATGEVFPIEVNPLRFGGWCTTADLTAHAYGFNPYLAYLRGERPDWPAILAKRAGKRFALVVLNNSTGRDVEEIGSFDHAAIAARFSRVLELRPVDHRRFRLFGFLFVEIDPDSERELEWILHSDLWEFAD